MNLVIVSDTAIAQVNGQLEILESPLREIESLAKNFDRIIWIGFLYENGMYNTRRPKMKNIVPIPLPSSGGSNLMDKLYVLAKIPTYFNVIYSNIKGSDMIHLRAPSVPAMIAMIINYYFKINRGWIKYAGAWRGKASCSYRLQRWWIKRYKILNSIILSKDTGSKNLHFLINPSIYKKDLENNQIANKDYSGKINIVFVGSLDENKRPDIVVDVIKKLDNHDRLGKLYIFGNGPLNEKLNGMAKEFKNIILMGLSSRDVIDQYYIKSHLLVLPSKSEGFPKVIAEAGLYGCVPITTSLDGIKSIIKHKHNGLLLNNNDISNDFYRMMNNIFDDSYNLELIAINLRTELYNFTYEKFSNSILEISRFHNHDN